jgi:hypothetical protein
MTIKSNAPVTTSSPPSSVDTLAKMRADDPRTIAAEIIKNATDVRGPNTDKIATGLAKLSETKPEKVAAVRAEIMKTLSPKDQGELLRLEFNKTEASMKNADGVSVDYEKATPAEQKQFITRISNAPKGSAEREYYDRLTNIWGKNPDKIQKGLDKLYDKGLTLKYAEKQIAQLNAISEKIAKEDKATQDALLDLGQLTLDIVGIFDPTPASDAINGVVSLFRGDFKGALISAVSIVPGAGDASKIAKVQKWAETIDNVLRLVSKGTRAGELLKPALKLLAKALEKIPPKLLEKLPDEIKNFVKKTIDVLNNDKVRDAAGDGLSAAKAAKNLMDLSKDADLQTQFDVLSQQIFADLGVPDTQKTTVTQPPTGTTTTVPSSN